MIRIKSTFFVASVVLQNGKVVRAAPIIKYMKGWLRQRVIEYCQVRGWQFVEML